MTDSSAPTDKAGYSCPVARGPLDHTLSLPGSKSLTNRELVLAALSDGPSTLHAPLHARDTDLMVLALKRLGATVEPIVGEGQFGPDLAVIPLPTSHESASTTPIEIDCGLAGTVMRFVPPLALLQSGPVRFSGDRQANSRPMGPIIEALRQLGHEVEDQGRSTLPFTLTPRVDHPAVRPRVAIDASGSSQFVSGLLLVAPRLPLGLTVEHTGGSLPSIPHIDMTVSVLADRGVVVERPEAHIFDVAPQTIRARSVTIEPDLSNAAPFLAAAVVAGGTVTVDHWPSTTSQVGALVPRLLENFGATATQSGDRVSVSGRGVANGPLPAVTLDLRDAGELAPTLITLSVFGDGPSVFSGIAHLRGHETDRIAALTANIRALGGVAEETPDGVRVTPTALSGGVWKAWGDHRMATSGALVGLAVPGVVVDDIGQTHKTLPEFAPLWQTMVG